MSPDCHSNRCNAHRTPLTAICCLCARRSPHIPKPTGAYGQLWYGTDQDAKYFLNEARPINCQYSFTSMDASHVKVKGRGKPIFQRLLTYVKQCLTRCNNV